jgi:hypothetical protein
VLRSVALHEMQVSPSEKLVDALDYCIFRGILTNLA